MKIAINTRLLLKGRMEGIAVFTWEICKRLVINHPEDQFYFFFDRTPHHSFINFKNVTSIVLKPQARHPLLWKYWFDFALTNAFKKHQIDVFFSPEFYLSKKSTVPTVIVTHDLGFLQYPDTYKKHHVHYFKQQVPLFLNQADHIIAVSNFTKNEIIKSYNIIPEKISVIGNAVRSIFKPLCEKEKTNVKQSISEGLPFILYLGSIHPRKNLNRLVKAFDQFKQESTQAHKLVLYGRWAFKNEQLKSTLEKSSYRKDIIFCGDDHMAVEKVVASASCLIYPSLYEGFGIPIIEAMACGVPVITSDRGAMKEVGGDAAIYMNPNSVEDISKAIDTLCSNNDVNKDKLLQNVSRYSWDASARHVYESLLSARNSAKRF